MKNSQKGFIVLILIAVAVIISGVGLYYLYNNSQLSIGGSLGICSKENKEPNETTAGFVREQSELSSKWETQFPQVGDIVKEIADTCNSDDRRIFFSRSLVSLSSKTVPGHWTERDITPFRKQIADIIQNERDSAAVRAMLADSVPRAYYYLGIKNISDLKDAFSLMLQRDDEEALMALGGLKGAAANIDLEGVKQIIVDFVKDYRENTARRPKTMISSLLTFEYDEGNPSVNEARSYVCSQREDLSARVEQAGAALRVLCK